MAMYQNREHYERAASFGHYEDPPKFAKSSPYRGYGITGLGQKYRMHPFAAAVLRARLRGLDELNAGNQHACPQPQQPPDPVAGTFRARCRPTRRGLLRPESTALRRKEGGILQSRRGQSAAG